MALPSASFVYDSLKPGSIRLISNLSIISSPSTGDHEIKCMVEEVALDQNPKYDCLSYTWDEPLYQKHLLAPRIYTGTTYPIDCKGQILTITENLRDALVEIGKGRSGQGNFQREDKIWIDAVCINQKNEEEKIIQIGMMSQIYANAQNVVVWLGPEMPDDPGLKSALLVMGRLSQIPPEKFKIAVLSRLGNADTYQNLGIDFIGKREWVCFGAFILRRWFSRMWVVQETFFAKNFIVFCGSNILPWSQITSASRVLKETSLGALLNETMEDRDRTIREPRTASEYITNPIANQFRFYEYKIQASPLTLERLLADSRYFGAKEAQDRVFAVLNIWKPKWDRADADEKTAAFIMKSTIPAEVYERASIVAIRETKDLNLLSLVEDKGRPDRRWQRLPGLPSWVPDFSSPPVWTPLAGSARAANGVNRWDAAKGLTFELPAETDSHHLLPVKGIQVDDIVDFAETDLNLIDEHMMYTLLEVLSRYLESANPPGASAADRFESFWKTLIKDLFLGGPATLEARKAFPMIIIHFIRELEYEIDALREALENPLNETRTQDQATRVSKLLETYSRTRHLVERLGSLDNSVIPNWEVIQKAIKTTKDTGFNPEEMHKDLINIMESFDAAYQCRRLFRTKTNLLGISAQSLDTNDVVWVLAGAAVPVVLRRRPKVGNWEFVGEAYVHGIMNGEAAVGQELSIFLE
jgi:Heterokaryon incompatibility protein (HET)